MGLPRGGGIEDAPWLLTITRKQLKQPPMSCAGNNSVNTCGNYTHRRRRRGEQGGTCPPPKIREKYFSGNYYVKFGNFLNFSGKNHVKFGHFANF